MKKSKRILSFIAAMVMLVTMSVFALPASAAAPAAITDLLAKYEAYDQELFNSVGAAAIQTAIDTLAEIVEKYDSMEASAALSAAQSADTTAQAGMMKNLVDGAWIPYSQRATYSVYVKDGVTIKDYAISAPADWLALVNDTNVAAGKAANRFSGFTFHFTTDIDMENQPMNPVGYGDEFNGFINGHNHVFKRINLQADSSKHTYIGLVDNVIWGGIQNLGIESGSITVTGTTAANVGAFAGNLRSAYVRKCWNAASISVQNAKSGGFGGIVGNCTSSAPVIDGCFNIGTLTSDNAVERYGLHGYGGGQASAYNSFAHGWSTAMGDQLVRYHTNIIGENCDLPIENTYSTGNLLFSWNGTIPTNYTTQYEAFCQAHTLTAEAYTGGELAYKLNQGYVSTGTGDGLPIFYTNGNGKVFFGTEANQTRKITFEGAKTDTYYLAANATYDMNETFGVNAMNSAFITVGTASSIVGGELNLKNEDITIKIINDCEHANGFAYTAENGVHTKVCKDGCGYRNVEPCAAASYTADAISAEALAKGEKATHTGKCTTCGFDFSKECAVEYVAPADSAEEHYWAFEGCACGREAIVNNGTADMIWGDAKVDGAINILDGIAILRSIVGLVSVNEKNADADADTNVTVDDAVVILRAWLGDADAQALAQKVEATINANLFDKAAATNGSGLNMDGSVAARTDHYVSAAIAVKPGQTLAFGPVRLGQPVFGYAYDAEGKALDLINYESTTVRSTLKEGMALVAYTVPANAATVKVNVPASDADLYTLRLNSKMYAAEYGARMGIDPDTVASPLYKKAVLTVGDSICEAKRDVAVGGLKGWASSIYQEFDANVTNSGVSGASFYNGRYLRSGYLTSQISNQINQHAGTKNFEYILIHGGINDAWDNASLGTVSATFDPSTFDVTTFAGGMELAIYEAVKAYGNTAAIGYHINFAAPLHASANDFGDYIPTAKAICAKWGIKYVDIYSMEFDTRLYTDDYIHPNEEGYDILGEPICEFMPQMRPVPLAVWEAVRETL